MNRVHTQGERPEMSCGASWQKLSAEDVTLLNEMLYEQNKKGAFP
jgi:hypothetical protein